ncbi:MAG: hypothetical protein M3R45_03010 [Pseudomonadota bacterium]|nr:hypothetical protein [Pseudomonadota bacterium]
MATDPNVPPPEPVPPLSTPPEPGEVQTTPMPTLSQTQGSGNEQSEDAPRPAQDENQPGFIGQRNLPHP